MKKRQRGERHGVISLSHVAPASDPVCVANCSCCGGRNIVLTRCEERSSTVEDPVFAALAAHSGRFGP